jgi:hypothetical protein
MAITMRIKTLVEVVDNTGLLIRPIGQALNDAAIEISAATGAIYHQSHSVAASGIIKLWDLADDTADFDALVVKADQVGQLQYVNKAAANFFTIETIAGLVTVLGGDASLDSTGTVGAFDGSADNIERVYWKNTSSSTAIIEILAVT